MRSMLIPKSIAHGIALLPCALLASDIWGNALGPDPVAEITHRSGDWALRFVLLALSVSPLRRITGWGVLARFRRLIGLYGFFYASLHFTVYLLLDLGGYWAQVLDDVLTRPYITVGFVAWLGLLLLAATSTRGMMRRLGRSWSRLHRLAYAIGALGVLHYVWLVKADLREPLLYAAALLVLLLLRVPTVSAATQRRRPPAPRAVSAARK